MASGFSCLIEFEGQKILFDTGADFPALCSNRKEMGLSFSEITHLLFSHRHFDHVDGFKEVVAKLPKTAHVYLPRSFSWKLRRKAESRLKTLIVSSFEEITPNFFKIATGITLTI